MIGRTTAAGPQARLDPGASPPRADADSQATYRARIDAGGGTTGSFADDYPDATRVRLIRVRQE